MGDLDAERRLAAYYLRRGEERPQPEMFDIEDALRGDGFQIIPYNRESDDIIAVREDIRFRTRRWDNQVDIALSPGFSRWAEDTLFSAAFPWDEEMYLDMWKLIYESLAISRTRRNPYRFGYCNCQGFSL